MLSKKIKDDFYWVGNLDPDLRVFDIVMRTEFGTTYNSYILKGSEKNVLFEAAKLKYFDEYLEKIADIIPFEKIDYLVVDHTEPDHTGTIEKMLDIYPDLEIIGTQGAINFLKEITNREFNGHIVKAGDELDIGGKTLKFIPAPNLHWPDTMFTYIPEISVLLTCDCFGSHYSDENITNDDLVSYEDYMSATIYYFDNILGPFKSDIKSALEKIKDLKIDVIATGHGPVITDRPERLIGLYTEWIKPKTVFKKKTVIIPYVTAYGFTKMLADKIVEGIKSAGDIDIRMHDMVYADPNEVLNEIAYADGFLLGTPTIVGEALPPIWALAADLNAKIHGGKFASAFGAYGWSGEGVPHIIERLRQVKLNVYKDGFRIRFKPSEQQLADAYEFGAGFGKAIIDGKLPE